MCHINFVEPMLILSMRINGGHTKPLPTLIYSRLLGPHLLSFSRKLVWVITLFCATFILKLISNVLVGSPHEVSKEDTGVLDPW